MKNTLRPPLLWRMQMKKRNFRITNASERKSQGLQEILITFLHNIMDNKMCIFQTSSVQKKKCGQAGRVFFYIYKRNFTIL
jgi:hypothetical protein